MNTIPAEQTAIKPEIRSFLWTLLHQPKKTWLRKACFQIHLWLGILLALYVAVVGLSGSILVFREDFIPIPKTTVQGQKTNSARADLETIVRNARAAQPDRKLLSVFAPNEDTLAWTAYLQNEKKETVGVVLDPVNGHVVTKFDYEHHWMHTIQELHIFLLSGKVGFLINGIGSICLLLVLLSGLVLWWPGIKNWLSACKLDFRRNWKRINWDLHSVIGFWTLAICSIWAISTIYFVWPKQFTGAISKISAITDATIPPKVELPPRGKGASCAVSFNGIVQTATRTAPATQFTGIYFPPMPKAPASVFMARGKLRNRSTWDVQFFDPCTGKQLGIWHRWQSKSFSDWIISLMAPLHFGILWGFPFRVIWSLLGLSLPLLSVTGLIMYWNRYLRKKWWKMQTVSEEKA